MAIFASLLVAAVTFGMNPQHHSADHVRGLDAFDGGLRYIASDPAADARARDEASAAGLEALDAAGIPHDYLERELPNKSSPRMDAQPVQPDAGVVQQGARDVKADNAQRAAPSGDPAPDSGVLNRGAESVAARPQIAFGPPAEPTLAASTSARIPVIGLEGPGLDACAAIGRVSNLGRERLSELIVHIAPATTAGKADTLEAGTLVWLCEAADKWQGIVYATGEFQELSDCRVSSPVAKPEDYDGPCAHGWVEGRFLTVVAG